MINFLAEISELSDLYIYPTASDRFSPTLPAAGAMRVSIYELDIRKREGYWADVWGGHYDHFQGSDIELHYGRYLSKPASINDMLRSPYSLFIEDGIVYMNIPAHPWFYPDYSTENRRVIPILRSVLDPGNPSFSIVNDTQAMVRLETPAVNVKLSDGHNGVSLHQGFGISLANNDGLFDDEEEWNLFNTPVHLKKSTVENPCYSDFKKIRGGFIDSTSTTPDGFDITVSDRIRAMNEPACRIIEADTFADLGIAARPEAIGRSIPVVFGTMTVRLTRLDETRYVAAERIESIVNSRVYDRNGNARTVSNNTAVNREMGIITVNDPDFEAETARVTGYAGTGAANGAVLAGWFANRIHNAVLNIIVNKAGLRFLDSYWNIAEINRYSAPRVNMTIEGGTVSQAVADILKSDMAYLIQQGNDRLTIRRYGTGYAVHQISSKMLTKKPEKDFSGAKENYFSTCVINYDRTDRETYRIFLFADGEREAFRKYKKRLTRTFETNLTTEAEARTFAVLLGGRYTRVRQTIKIGLGIDTSGMELLDTVVMDMDLNGRQFSRAGRFIIREIDKAQDTLVLEEA